MSLVPADGVLSLVAKAARRDPAGTDVLVRLALYESLSDLVDADRSSLERAMVTKMADRNDEARRELVRGYLARRTEGQPVDGYLESAARLTVADAYVVKSLSGSLLNLFNQDHHRDEKGRFTRGISTGNTYNQDQAGDRHADLALQAKAVATGWQRDGLADEHSVVIISNRKGDKMRARVGELLNGQLPIQSGFMPTQLALDPATLKNQDRRHLAAYDAMSAAVGPSAAGRFSAHIPTTANLGSFTDQVTGDRKDRNYRRIGAVGGALTAVSDPGSPMGTVGGVAQLVGELGPQAEKILGPGLQRTAYRYRGTEKTPDRALVSDIRRVDALLQHAQEAGPGQSRLAGVGQTRGELPPPVRIAAYHFNQRGQTEDQAEMLTRGDTAVNYLARKLPSPKATELSIEAGRVPPSQGVIIDDSGNVVTEAMGYASDHYLPFDLRNLGRLNGGQYVRTRAMGGPTAEDVYTGLLTGARQMQVVSNSGVFTVEFDPSLRGGRRYSDKGRQMIRRYTALLAAVDSEALYAQDIPAAEKHQLRVEAYAQAGHDEKTGEDYYRQALQQARTKAMVAQDDDEFEAQADATIRAEPGAKQLTGQQLAAARADEVKRLKNENQVRRYQLNGEGYAAALTSLQEEFPYFIRTAKYQTLHEFLSTRRLYGPDEQPLLSTRRSDKGYVRPGAVNPHSVKGHADEYRTRERDGAKTTSASTEAAAALTPAARMNAGVPTPSTSQGIQVGRDLSVQVQLPVRQPVALDQALEQTRTAFTRDLGNALSASLPAAPQVYATTPKDSENDSDEDALKILASQEYVLWMLNKKGGGGSQPRKIAQFLTDPATNPQHRIKAIDGLMTLGQSIKSYESSETGEALANEYRPDALKQALTLLTTYDSLATPAQPLTGDALPGAVRPDQDRPVPIKFAEFDKLGVATENFEAYLEAAKIQRPELGAEIEQFWRQNKGMPKGPGAVNEVSDAVDDYLAIAQWGQTGSATNKPLGKMPTGATFVDAQTAARSPNASKYYLNALRKQMAWSYTVDRTVAETIKELGGTMNLGGGGAAPKPMAQPGLGPGQREIGKRAEVRVHAPGSPLAKALSTLMMKR